MVKKKSKRLRFLFFIFFKKSILLFSKDEKTILETFKILLCFILQLNIKSQVCWLYTFLDVKYLLFMSDHIFPIHLFLSLFLFRIHPEICNRGGSEGAGGRSGRLLFRKLHVWLFRGRSSGHGVVVKGDSFSPLPQRLYYFLTMRSRL